ncbi:hypothetical protein BIV59_04050 [Bacillus sp. MUM 13]|nr:hypothetical protein BIV59_04050 [Bacillus sp. MUM 13]
MLVANSRLVSTISRYLRPQLLERFKKSCYNKGKHISLENNPPLVAAAESAGLFRAVIPGLRWVLLPDSRMQIK